jgi:hypothetical protein
MACDIRKTQVSIEEAGTRPVAAIRNVQRGPR